MKVFGIAIPNLRSDSNFAPFHASVRSGSISALQQQRRKRRLKMKRFATRVVTLVIVVIAAVFLMPMAAGAQVLQQVPADALIVLKFNKIKATSDKLAA